MVYKRKSDLSQGRFFLLSDRIGEAISLETQFHQRILVSGNSVQN